MTKNDPVGRRDLRKQFEALVDTTRFEYEKRTEIGRAHAKLYGVIAAGLAYGLGFIGGYYAWQNQTLPAEQFSMLTWMWMVPCTFVGILVWKLVSTRREYPVRQEIKRYISELESGGGLLWRYAPLLDQNDIGGSVIGRVIELSHDGRINEIALEDYTKAVDRIHGLLNGARNVVPTADRLQRVARNFGDAA